MKKSLLFVIVMTAVVLMSVVSAFAQESAPAADDRAQIERKMVRTAQTMVAPVAQGPEAKASTFFWMESEFSFDGKPVKGSPYSAEAVTETTQTLSDGNRIVNRSSSQLYRDGEGRTRREQSLNYVSNLAAGPSVKTVMINDPVAGVTYSLDPESRTARKNKMFHYEFTPRATGPGGEVTVARATVAPRTTAPESDATVVQAARAARVSSGGTVSGSPTVTFRSDAAGTFTFKIDGDQKNFVKESLGTQSIEGVDAEGTRTTVTIPEGAIGNEKPILIVDERWYSPSLHTVVMTRHSDPRTGENVYRLTNINRTEPDHSLFEVPADYQIKDAPMTVMPEMRLKKPEQQ
jgi:hypothetical protein